MLLYKKLLLMTFGTTYILFTILKIFYLSLPKKHVGYGNVCRFIHREYPCVVWLVFMSWTTTECCVTFDICILPTQCAYDLQVSKQTAIIYDLTVVLQWIAFFCETGTDS